MKPSAPPEEYYKQESVRLKYRSLRDSDIEKSSGDFIGLGGIIMREMNPGVDFEITYSFFPGYWGKGYATELAVHFKNFAFSNIETRSVVSMIHKDNLASINVAQKNGMTFASKTTFLNMPILIYRVFGH